MSIIVICFTYLQQMLPRIAQSIVQHLLGLNGVPVIKDVEEAHGIVPVIVLNNLAVESLAIPLKVRDVTFSNVQVRKTITTTLNSHVN